MIPHPGGIKRAALQAVKAKPYQDENKTNLQSQIAQKTR